MTIEELLSAEIDAMKRRAVDAIASARMEEREACAQILEKFMGRDSATERVCGFSALRKMAMIMRSHQG